MIRLAFYLIAGYIVGSALFADLTFDLTQTDWLNLWTYIYIAVGMAISWAVLTGFWLGVLAIVAHRVGKPLKQRKRW